jgi:hypothetical protein
VFSWRGHICLNTAWPSWLSASSFSVCVRCRLFTDPHQSPIRIKVRDRFFCVKSLTPGRGFCPRKSSVPCHVQSVVLRLYGSFGPTPEGSWQGQIRAKGHVVESFFQDGTADQSDLVVTSQPRPWLTVPSFFSTKTLAPENQPHPSGCSSRPGPACY